MTDINQAEHKISNSFLKPKMFLPAAETTFQV